jgi:predicted DNA-binding transcriptional regulator AlpA
MEAVGTSETSVYFYESTGTISWRMLMEAAGTSETSVYFYESTGTISWRLLMEAAGTSEASVYFYESKGYHIPEGCHLCHPVLRLEGNIFLTKNGAFYHYS